MWISLCTNVLLPAHSDLSRPESCVFPPPRTMPIARSDTNKLTDTPVIVVTSLRPRERSLLSVRQRRIAEFCSAEADRKRRKETRRRGVRKRTAVTHCIAAAALTATASCKVWNPGHLGLLMEQSEEELTQSDDVKVLFPARDILYSDSEVAVLSACSSWCVGITGKPGTPHSNPPPSRIPTRSTICPSLEDKNPPRPCGRVGLVDETGVGDRYLNKPPEGFLSSDDVVNIVDGIERKEVQKPYRQVWHSLWEHQVGRESSKSTNASQPVDRLVFSKARPVEQVTASANNICSARNMERKQRLGVFHPPPIAQTRMYHMKTINRPWGRPMYQRATSTGTRVAQRKMTAMKDETLVGDSESLFERSPRIRRAEPTKKKQGVPRVVVTTASRPMTAVPPERFDSSSAHPRSAPAKPRTSENFNNRLPRFSTTAKPMNRPRFSVPIRASRVPMDLLFKEMNSPKLNLSKKYVDTSGGFPIKYRGTRWVSNEEESQFADLNQNANLRRDAGQSVCFDTPDKSRTATSRNSRRLYNRPNVDVNESNPPLSYSTSLGIDAECLPISENLLDDSLLAHSKPRTSLRPHTGRFVERGPHRKMSSANLPILSHFYGNPVTPKLATLKSPPMFNYNMESDDSIHPVSHYPVPSAGVPPLYQSDLSSHYLYDGFVAPNQTPRAFHFSHPNAPDVLISPPPNPGRRGDTLRVPGSSPDVEPSPKTVFIDRCAPTVRFVPRYFGLCSPESTIDDDCIVPQPFLQTRPFMPSVDFSRIGPPPIQHPEALPCARDDHQKLAFAQGERIPYSTILQHAGIPVSPVSSLTQGKKASGPLKMLLTFGAQVPSSERVPLSPVICGYLSSPQAEAVTFLGSQDLAKQSIFPNSHSKVSADVQNREEKSWVKPVTSEAFSVVESVTQTIKTAVNAEGNPVVYPAIKYCTCTETTDAIKKKGKDSAIFVNEEKVKNNNMSTRISTDRSERITKTSPLVGCGSILDLKITEFSTKHLELAKTRSVGLCACTYSDADLSAERERSSEIQQPARNFPTEVSAHNLGLAYARDTSSTYRSEIEQGRARLQLVESRDVDTASVSEKDHETLVTNRELVGFMGDISNIQAVSGVDRSRSSEVITGDVSSTEPYDEDSSGNCDTILDEHYWRVSEVKPSCTESTAYQLSSSCQQFTNRKSSFAEISAIKDNQVTALLLSDDSANSRDRFRSLVARHHIALQCRLAKQPGPASGVLNTRNTEIIQSPEIRDEDQQKVQRKDVCVQVPVLCCRSIETEPYTAEKGVPESRAGLSLRLLSTVVDVPPIVKTTESVGIGTEDEPNEEDSLREESHLSSGRTRDSDSNLTCEIFCSTTAFKSSSPISFDYNGDRRPLVNVPVTDKHLGQLKPFFKSHCRELANIYTLAAMHSVTLNADSARSPTLSKEENLRTGSSTSIEARKDKHPNSCDRDHSCDHEQTGRVPKQVVYDRRVAFRPVKRETNRMCPQADFDEASGLRFEDEHSEHHRTPDVHGRCPNYKIDPPLTKDHRQWIKSNSSPRRACHFAKVDQHLKTGSEKDIAGCRRKLGELSNPARPLSENVDFDNAIALNRKPGCAVCKKEHSPTSKKRGILKRKEAEGKQTPDVRGSIMQIGLSNIVAPCRTGYESPNANTEEQINVNLTYNSFCDKSRNHSSQEVEYLRSLASAVETAKRSVPLDSGEASRFRNDPVSVNYENRPVVVRDTLACNQCQKQLSRELLDGKTDPGSSAFAEDSKRASVTSRSTVPTIFLTKAESNDASGLEYPATSVYSPPMQIAFSSVDTTMKDFAIDLKRKDSSEGMPLKESNSAVDVSVAQTAPSFVEISLIKGKDIEESGISNSERLEHAPVETLSVETPSKQVDTAVDDRSQELKEEPVSVPTDREVVDKQTSSPKLAPFPKESKPMESLDSAYSYHSSGGCVFTAMRRYMKSHQRPERSSNYGQPAYWSNKCPGFRFAGVSVARKDSLPVDGRDYRDCCKCDLSDRGPSAELRGEFGPSLSRIPQSCTTDPASSPQKNDLTNVRDVKSSVSNAPETDEVQNSDPGDNDGANSSTKTSPQTKMFWQNVLQRYKSKPLSQSAADVAKSVEGLSQFQLIQNSSTKNIPDSSLKHVMGVCSPESSRCRPESSEHTCSRRDKKGSVDKPIQAIRTLPPDMAAVEAFRMRYPRGASTFPETCVWARRRGSRKTSAPAGEVRIRHGRCFPPDQSRGPRRFLHEQLEAPDDGCQHRKARQRIVAWVYDDSDSLYDTDEEAFVVDDRDELDDDFRYNHFCPCRVSQKDHEV